VKPRISLRVADSRSQEFVPPLACLLDRPGSQEAALSARAILERRDLLELSRADPLELAAELELDRASAERIAAAFVLARGLAREHRPRRPRVRTPEAVFELLETRFRGLEFESFVVLTLDGKHRLRRLVPVSTGTLQTSLVHPREVFRPAIREAAAALIVAHNHPSGDPEPSAEDLEVTRRLRQAGELVGIPLLDHVVVGEQAFVSIRERDPTWAAGGASPSREPQVRSSG